MKECDGDADKPLSIRHRVWVWLIAELLGMRGRESRCSDDHLPVKSSHLAYHDGRCMLATAVDSCREMRDERADACINRQSSCDSPKQSLPRGPVWIMRHHQLAPPPRPPPEKKRSHLVVASFFPCSYSTTDTPLDFPLRLHIARRRVDTPLRVNTCDRRVNRPVGRYPATHSLVDLDLDSSFILFIASSIRASARWRKTSASRSLLILVFILVLAQQIFSLL